MLSALTIDNIVLIDHLDLDFHQGFTVLTGETGAGKSILLDSLSLITGARADTGLIRKGAEKASVTAVFDVGADVGVSALLQDLEIGMEGEDHLVIRRILTSDGRSKAFINDQPVSVGTLKSLGALLVDIHSQFETHSLLDVKSHRSWLDQFMGQPGVIGAVSDAWQRLSHAKAALTAFSDDLLRAKEEQDYWQACVEALDQLAPQSGEEDGLMNARATVAMREQIQDRYHQALDALQGDDGALARANQAWKSVQRVHDGEEDFSNRLDQVMTELQDIADGIDEAMRNSQSDTRTVEEIDDRLIALRAEARKHQVSCDDLPEIRDRLAEKLSHILQGGDRLSALESDVRQAEEQYSVCSKALSDARAKAALKLTDEVMVELAHLRLDKARFVVEVSHPQGESGPLGMDRVLFTIASNPGQSPAPIHKAASGGELSRIMLAMKIVFARVFPVQTMIFDEIDSGMGGATADALAQRLAALSNHCQLLAVSHAPQIAALGEGHFIVSKAENDQGVVRSHVQALASHEERREEIARMLSGAEITSAARAAAESLMQAKEKQVA